MTSKLWFILLIAISFGGQLQLDVMAQGETDLDEMSLMATRIRNFIQNRSRLLQKEAMEKVYADQMYGEPAAELDGGRIVQAIAETLTDEFRPAITAVLAMGRTIEEAASRFRKDDLETIKCESLDSSKLEFVSRRHQVQDEYTTTAAPKSFDRMAKFADHRVSANYSLSSHRLDDAAQDIQLGAEKARLAAAEVCMSLELENLFGSRRDMLASQQPQVDASKLLWSYFGSMNGVSRWFPAFKWNDLQLGDEWYTRNQPWYNVGLGMDEVSKRVVFVIDSSGSMVADQSILGDSQPTHLEDAKAAVLRVVGMLSSTDRLNIIFFDNEARSAFDMRQPLVQCIPQKLAEIRNFIVNEHGHADVDLADYNKGLQLAFDLVAEFGRQADGIDVNCARKDGGVGCESVVVFISNGYSSHSLDYAAIKQQSEALNIRCDIYRYIIDKQRREAL